MMNGSEELRTSCFDKNHAHRADGDGDVQRQCMCSSLPWMDASVHFDRFYRDRMVALDGR